MRLFALYTRSHEPLFTSWFQPTIWPGADLQVDRIETLPGGLYRSEQWSAVIRRKLELIVSAMISHSGQLIIYSDVDVQFFCDPTAVLLNHLQGADIVFQQESPFGNICTGFFAARCTPMIARFWRDVARLVQRSNGEMHDQDAVNELLSQPRHQKLSVALLPMTFLGGGTQSGREWQVGRSKLDIPQNLVMHHANFAKGMVAKVDQLTWVRNEYRRQRQNDPARSHGA